VVQPDCSSSRGRGLNIVVVQPEARQRNEFHNLDSDCLTRRPFMMEENRRHRSMTRPGKTATVVGLGITREPVLYVPTLIARVPPTRARVVGHDQRLADDGH
jgi:hypothetical protein